MRAFVLILAVVCPDRGAGSVRSVQQQGVVRIAFNVYNRKEGGTDARTDELTNARTRGGAIGGGIRLAEERTGKRKTRGTD